MANNIPGPDWYYGMNKLRVKRDLEKTNLKDKLGNQLDSFIKFAAKQRFEYEEDIFAEYQEFLERDKRLCETDIDTWQEIRKQVFERDNYTCSYCRQKGGNLEVDHMIPFSRGGSEELDNLTTSCVTCNRQKKDKTPEEFEKWREKQNG